MYTIEKKKSEEKKNTKVLDYLLIQHSNQHCFFMSIDTNEERTAGDKDL